MKSYRDEMVKQAKMLRLQAIKAGYNTSTFTFRDTKAPVMRGTAELFVCRLSQSLVIIG